MSINKKYFSIFISILSIIGYGYFAFAVITPGQTLDPVADSLCTGPNDPACVINQAWEQDLVNNLVFNNTAKIGIGVDANDFGFIGLINPDVHINGNILLTKNDQVNGPLVFKQGDLSFFGRSHGFAFLGIEPDLSSSWGRIVLDKNEGASISSGTQISLNSDEYINLNAGIQASLFSEDQTLGQESSSVLYVGTKQLGMRFNTLSSNNDGNGTPLVIQVADENSRGGGFSARSRNQSFSFAGADMFVWDDAFGGDRTWIWMDESKIDSGLLFDVNNQSFGNFTTNNINEISFDFNVANPDPSMTSDFTINQNFTWSKPSTLGTIMSLDGATGDLIIAGSLTQNSDERLKSNINRLTYGLDAVNILNPVSYTLNINGTPQFGFIAQDVQRVLPELVNDSKEYLSLNYIGMIPILTKAIQELDLKLESIQSASSTVVASSGFSLNSLRTWLGDVGNGIQKIFAKQIKTEELCIDDVCFSAEEAQKLKLLINNNFSDNNPSINNTNPPLEDIVGDIVEIQDDNLEQEIDREDLVSLEDDLDQQTSEEAISDQSDNNEE